MRLDAEGARVFPVFPMEKRKRPSIRPPPGLVVVGRYCELVVSRREIWLIVGRIRAKDRAQVLRTRKSNPDGNGAPITGGSRFFLGQGGESEKTPGARTRSLHGSCDPPDVFLMGSPVARFPASRDPCEPLLPRPVRRPIRSRFDPVPTGPSGLRPVGPAFVRSPRGSSPDLRPVFPPTAARRPLRPPGFLRSVAVGKCSQGDPSRARKLRADAKVFWG